MSPLSVCLVHPPFSFSQQQQKQHLGRTLWGSPCQEAKHPHSPWLVSKATGNKDIGRVWLLASWVPSLSECAGGPGGISEGRAACQFWGTGTKQINCSRAPGSAHCAGLPLQQLILLPSCHWLARLTPEAAESRCGHRGSSVLARGLQGAPSTSPSSWLELHDFLLWGYRQVMRDKIISPGKRRFL